MSGFTLRRARAGAGTGILAAALGALMIFAGGSGALAAGATWTVQPSPDVTVSGGQLESVSCSSPSACTAVGDYTNTSGVISTLAERWNGLGWQQQATPSPAGEANSTQPPELLGVSCPTGGFCAAAGENQQSFTTDIFAETWSGGQWTMQSVPVPDGADSPTLTQVSCTSATFCVAVGSYIDSNFDLDPLAEVWNGTSWSLQSTPALTTDAGFTTVSCTSPRSCEAWGGGNNNFSGPEIAEQFNGTSWQQQTVPSDAAAVDSVSCVSATFCEAVAPGAAYAWDGSQWTAQTVPSSLSSAGLNGVSCTSARFCEAVGVDFTPVAAVWNGSAWSAQSAPSPAGASFVPLNAVSCASARSCEAVGGYMESGSPNEHKTLEEAWNGKAWALQPATGPAGATDNSLGGVSCVSGTFCVAVGSYTDSDGDTVNLAEIWNGTSWRITSVPTLAAQNAAVDEGLDSVSCVSASFCQAVGSGQDGSFAALWNGTSWTVQTITSPGVGALEVSCATVDFCMSVDGSGNVNTWNGSSWSAGSSVPGFRVTSLSCLSASFCEVVGEGPTGENATAWDGTSWTDQATPGPVSNSFDSVSCSAADSCEAVGQMLDSGDQVVPLAEVWDGTAWTIQPTPDPAAAQETESPLTSVSCASASSCTAVGNYQSASLANYGERQTLAEVWDGTSWSIATTPDPSSAGNNDLFAVSCGAVDTCTAVGQYQDAGGTESTLIEAGD
jgi:hypothetical protein